MKALVGEMNLRCEEYDSGGAFLDSYDPADPGCLVTEVRVPDVGGLQIQERLARSGIGLPVIFLTAYPDTRTAVSAMRAGALQFLVKPFREDELWEAILEAVALDRELRREEAQLSRQRDLIECLTSKERAVLEKIIDGKPNRIISEELEICLRTVELRRASLMNKLRVESLADLLQLVGGAYPGDSQSIERSTHHPRNGPGHLLRRHRGESSLPGRSRDGRKQT
ncbi:MAG: response regulator transcription factor [Pirellulales bacterium]|nr:response regulator transcription factor [Pirellulales bacterium]